MSRIEQRMTIRSLRGAPLTVLFAMLWMPDLHGEEEISVETGYSRKTVRKALVDLEALGFVNRNGRYEAWILTTRARQMVLGESVDEQDAIETTGRALPDTEGAEGAKGKIYPSMGKFYPSPRSSSSTTHVNLSDQSSKTTTTTTTDGEGEILPIDGEAAVAVDRLTATGIPAHTKRGNGARDAVHAAVKAGWSGPEILAAVAGWLAYCESPRGKGIRHAGFYTASRIARCEPAPSAPQVTQSRDREAVARSYIEAEMERRRRS